MNIVEFHRIDQNNPGDLFSNPSRYFFPDKETKKIDIDNVKRTEWHQKDTIIVGGGGLIGNDNFERFMGRITTHPDELILIDILETKLKNVSEENKSLLQNYKSTVQKYTQTP